MEPSEANNSEKPSEIYVERDVLGLEKPQTGAKTGAHPARIFIGLAIAIVVVALACWVLNK